MGKLNDNGVEYDPTNDAVRITADIPRGKIGWVSLDRFYKNITAGSVSNAFNVVSSGKIQIHANQMAEKSWFELEGGVISVITGTAATDDLGMLSQKSFNFQMTDGAKLLYNGGEVAKKTDIPVIPDLSDYMKKSVYDPSGSGTVLKATSANTATSATFAEKIKSPNEVTIESGSNPNRYIIISGALMDFVDNLDEEATGIHSNSDFNLIVDSKLKIDSAELDISAPHKIRISGEFIDISTPEFSDDILLISGFYVYYYDSNNSHRLTHISIEQVKTLLGIS
ncbi:hypothetical protein D0T49_03890 [Paludibacter sp. 221]|uniref:hypothetical protein n=1 Tax=Paludibacter sp. 221 TaxID=2302939 RepID=UPI0013D10265|nr:hypothetical protein [Paludibacter sp. 221]NDV46182.1 hypothetical protein [Paludibacter sp. 221]